MRRVRPPQAPTEGSQEPSFGATRWTCDGCVGAGRLVALACSGVGRAAPRRSAVSLVRSTSRPRRAAGLRLLTVLRARPDHARAPVAAPVGARRRGRVLRRSDSRDPDSTGTRVGRRRAGRCGNPLPLAGAGAGRWRSRRARRGRTSRPLGRTENQQLLALLAQLAADGVDRRRDPPPGEPGPSGTSGSRSPRPEQLRPARSAPAFHPAHLRPTRPAAVNQVSPLTSVGPDQVRPRETLASVGWGPVIRNDDHNARSRRRYSRMRVRIRTGRSSPAPGCTR